MICPVLSPRSAVDSVIKPHPALLRLLVCGILCSTSAGFVSADEGFSPCLPTEEVKISDLQIAQSGAIVSRTRNSVQLAPNAKTRTIKQGGKTIMSIADPNGGVPATIDCICNQLPGGLGGYCFPVQIGNSVACQSSLPGGCACMMGLVIPDPPG
jgi:hypothetical protein